jgi:hypothetical protein
MFWEEVRTKMNTTTIAETEVLIPGRVIARVRNGRIVGYVFIPNAADAGYFGDEIVVISGDESLEKKPNDFFDMVSDSLTFDQSNSVASFVCEWES